MTKANILVVEDNKHDTLLIKKLFSNSRIKNSTKYANNISSAREIINTTNFDLAFIDIVLPDGSGLDVAELLGGLQPHCAVVILSGTKETDTVMRAKEIGVETFVAKPLDLPLLQETIKPFENLHWFIGVDKVAS